MLAGDLRRSRSNARHYRLFVRGKGGVERELDVPAATQAALEAWIAVHPLARGRALRDNERVFVRRGRRGSEEPSALSAQAVYRSSTAPPQRRVCRSVCVTRMRCAPTGATCLLEDGVAVHVVQAGLGHADLATTGRYAVVRPEHQAELVDVLDRRHQDARRRRS